MTFFDIQRFADLTSLTLESSDIYLITSATDLQTLADYVNEGNDTSGLTFKLTADITVGNFNPIGSIEHTFKGTFDGNGHVISNLIINNPAANYQALFGCLNAAASVSNLIVIDPSINGADSVGVFVGYNNGSVNGYFHSTTDINGTGLNEGTDNSARIFSLSLPEGVTVTNGEAITVGSTVYYAKGSNLTLAVDNSENNFRLIGLSNAVQNADGSISYSIDADTAVSSQAIAKLDGFTFDSISGCYLINSANDLSNLANIVNTGQNDCTGLSFALGADINMGGVSVNAIGSEDNPFNGTLDGNHHSISNLTINNQSNNQALFGCLGSNASVSNIQLLDSNISAGENVAALVAVNHGAVKDCGVSGSIIGSSNVGAIVGNNQGGSVSGCINVASVEGSQNVGAIVGNNQNGSVSGYVYSADSNVKGVGAGAGSVSHVYSLELPTGLTASSDSTVDFNGITYYTDNATIALEGTPASGSTLKVLGTSSTFTLDNGNYKIASLTLSGLTTSTVANSWTGVEKNSASYVASKTAGAAISNDATTIEFSAAGNSNLFTLNGISNVDGITVGDDKVVTLSAGNLDNQTVSLKGDGCRRCPRV